MGVKPILKQVLVYFMTSLVLVGCSAGLEADEGRKDVPSLLLNDKAHLQQKVFIDDKQLMVNFSHWVDNLQKNLPTLSELVESVRANEFNVSETCLNDTEATINALLAREVYALQMFDATAKIPSGILNGNFRWAGSYEECLDVTSTMNRSDGRQFKGKYCTASLPNSISKIVPIPLTYTVCVPDSCSNSDVAGLLYTVIATAKLQTYIIEMDCSGPVEYDTAAIVSLVVVFILVAFLIMGTSYDMFHRYRCSTLLEPVHVNNDKLGADEERIGLLTGVVPQSNGTLTPPIRELTTFDKFMISFSAVTNGEKILSTSTPKNSITMLHGLRVLSMWWVILGHTHLMHFNNYNNLVSAVKSLFQKCLGQTIIHATFSVDTFFLLSGLLVTYLCLNEMKAKNGKINWLLFYFHRFWRLTPAYMFCLMFFTNLVQYVAPGPGTGVGGFGNQQCKDYWWTNLLYINNFVPLNNSKQCFGWAWYLANDMQFYVISPVILILLYRRRKIGISVCVVISLLCIIARGVIASYYGQMGIGVIGVPPVAPRNLYANADGFDYIYEKPYTRICVYLIGMVMGFVLYQTECKKVFHFKKIYILIGWVLSIFLGLSLVYGLEYDTKHQAAIGYDLQALYVALSRFAWGLAVAWVIFACVHGMGGPINKFLSWRFWLPLSRLTYCAYLVHPIWIVIYVHYQRNPTHYDDITMVYLYVGDLFFSYVIAFGISLLIEAPMIGLEKVIFRR